MAQLENSKLDRRLEEQQNKQVIAAFELKTVEKNGSVCQVLVGSFKQAFFSKLSSADKQILEQIIENDPRLSGGGKLSMPPRGDATVEAVEKQALTNAHGTELSLSGQAALKTFASFYQRYLSSFANEGETEPASSLWGYLGDKSMKWDIVLELDPKDYRPLAAASGQVIDVPDFAGTGSKIAWRENVWTAPVSRSFGLGHHVAVEFNALMMQRYGAEVTFGEVDSPYKMMFKEEISANPQMFSRDPSDRAERRAAWKAAGEEIDPFDRIEFHNKNMHQVAVYNDGGVLKPVPYCQISMDIESTQPYVTSLNYFLTPLTDKMTNSFAAGEIKVSHLRRLFELAEKTITDKVFEHPEFVRTRTALRAIEKKYADPEVRFLRPNSAAALDAFENVAGRDGMDKIAQDMRFAAIQFRAAERQDDFEKMERMRQHIKIGLNKAYDYLEVLNKPRHFQSALALLRQEGLRKGDRDTIRQALQFTAPTQTLESASFAINRPALAAVVKIVGLRALSPDLQDKYIAQAFEIYERVFPDANERLSRTGFENYVKDPGREGYDMQVALVDGEVVAASNFRVINAGDLKIGYQSYIYTRPDMQRQGIGSALFDCVIEAMKRDGAVAMFGEVNDPRLTSAQQIEADRRAGMDPTERLEFWSSKGRLSLDERYSQLGIDGGDTVDHLMINMLAIDPKFKGLTGRQYIAMLDAFFERFIPNHKSDPAYLEIVAAARDRAFIPLIPLTQPRSFLSELGDPRSEMNKGRSSEHHSSL